MSFFVANSESITLKAALEVHFRVVDPENDDLIGIHPKYDVVTIASTLAT